MPLAGSIFLWKYLLRSLPQSVTLGMEDYLEFLHSVRKQSCDDTEKNFFTSLELCFLFEKGGHWASSVWPKTASQCQVI